MQQLEKWNFINTQHMTILKPYCLGLLLHVEIKRKVKRPVVTGNCVASALPQSYDNRTTTSSLNSVVHNSSFTHISTTLHSLPVQDNLYLPCSAAIHQSPQHNSHSNMPTDPALLMHTISSNRHKRQTIYLLCSVAMKLQSPTT